VSKFLNEKEVGFDRDLIGFPNLGDCMAVVLLTQSGLFGYHFMPFTASEAGAFGTFITGRVPGRMLRLYGTCSRERRWPAEENTTESRKRVWQQEMTTIAKNINYQGKVSGFDTSESNTGIKAFKYKDEENNSKLDTVYVEYRLDGEKCKIFYKRMSKMTTRRATTIAEHPLIPQPDIPQRIFQLPGMEHLARNTADFDFRPPDPTRVITTRADIIPTDSNKGELHEVGRFSIDSFTV
jgi:hypothetical protein